VNIRLASLLAALALSGVMLCLSGGSVAAEVGPHTGPDGSLWICKESEEEMATVCIPWFPEEREESIGSFLGPNGGAKGPVRPVEDENGNLWLCRVDEDSDTLCIPWFQEIKTPRYGIFLPR
jgi:hypothetical protein